MGLPPGVTDPPCNHVRHKGSCKQKSESRRGSLCKRALFIMWFIKVTKVKAHLGWQDPNTKSEAQFSEEHNLGESSRQDTQLYACILKEKGHSFRLFGRSAKEVIDIKYERLSLNKGGGKWHQLPLSLHEIPVHTLNHVTWTNHMIGVGQGLRTLASDRRVMTHT